MIRGLARIWLSPNEVLSEALAEPGAVPFYSLAASWGIFNELMNVWRAPVGNTDGAPVLLWWLVMLGAILGPAKIAVQAEIIRLSANRTTGMDYARGSVVPVLAWSCAPMVFCLLLFARVPFLLDFDAVRFMAEARPEGEALASFTLITLAWRAWSAVLVLRGVRLMYDCSWWSAAGHSALAFFSTGLIDVLAFTFVLLAFIEL